MKVSGLQTRVSTVRTKVRVLPTILSSLQTEVSMVPIRVSCPRMKGCELLFSLTAVQMKASGVRANVSRARCAQSTRFASFGAHAAAARLNRFPSLNSPRSFALTP